MKIRIIICLLALFSIQLHAKEGMWIPYLLAQLNQAEMQEMGLEITAEQIYSVNNSSIKDAIVHFGGGCTAEIISSKGLLLTNHHCGYSQIQSHSTVEKNYLKNGFWAMSSQEELQNKGLTAAIVKYMEDVTNEVMEGLNDEMTISERSQFINNNIRSILKSRSMESPYDLSIVPFFYGNQFILIAKETFKDVRLVGAPPSSIGKFGADTDNWVWPRHTGDFSIFRIYAGKDNKPAEYSEDNVPYSPNFHLKVNTSGVKDGDFSMIYGFPGTTQEYLPSNEVYNIAEVYNPARIDIRDRLLKILDKKMRKSEASRLQYASKYARISNSWKKWIGERNGLKESKGINRKENFENEFLSALNSKTEWRNEYGDVLDQLKKLYDDRKPAQLERYHYIEVGYYGLGISRHMLRYRKFIEESKDEEADLGTSAEKLMKGMLNFYESYDQDLDLKAMHELLPIYLAAISNSELPEELGKLKSLNETELHEYIDELFEDLIFLEDPKKFEKLMSKKPWKAAKKIEESSAYKLSVQMYEHYKNVLNQRVAEINDKIDFYQGRYLKALREVFPDKRFYPDANSTLRLAYGKVEPYFPKDGVKFETKTYLSGVMAKYVPGDYEFDLPAKLLELYEAKDYGIYGEDGKMPVCFIASNHTTGGNSGSPALNSRGELVGLNFDRAWEGTMSDLNYDIRICRNIMVDVRYVLFIVDKFAGAGYLVEEMDLVNNVEAKAEEVDTTRP
tara:strand:+ start:59490 stop:61685 length:2196 start_codon:yes stop_codon:yes gene_type:complete